jgi:uncharacterized UPF0146 family protein
MLPKTFFSFSDHSILKIMGKVKTQLHIHNLKKENVNEEMMSNNLRNAEVIKFIKQLTTA